MARVWVVAGGVAIPQKGSVVMTSLRHHFVMPRASQSDALPRTSASSGRAVSPFGQRLRHWRRLRGMSQLQLATMTESSARHLSFIETGRSRPSAKVIHRLAEALDIPLRERNELLTAAGLPAEYPDRPLDDNALAQYRRIVTQILEAHEPFPAFAIDRWWQLVEINQAGTRMFGPVTPDTDLIEFTFADGPMRQLIDNWAEVAWASVDRLRRELAHSGGDERLAEMLGRAEAHLAKFPRPRGGEVAGVVCPRFRIGDQRIETVGTIMSFGTPREVVLDELRVELIFPANEAAENFFRQLAG